MIARKNVSTYVKVATIKLVGTPRVLEVSRSVLILPLYLVDHRQTAEKQISVIVHSITVDQSSEPADVVIAMTWSSLSSFVYRVVGSASS